MKPASILTSILLAFACQQTISQAGDSGQKNQDASSESSKTAVVIAREVRDVSGWKVHVNQSLLDSNRAGTDHALTLLKKMLDEIIRVVPKAAVIEMQKVPLYFSPPYPNKGAGAEFHPHAGWLRDNGDGNHRICQCAGAN